MAFPLSYCPSGADVLDRLRRLYLHRDTGIVCAVARTPSPALARFARDHPPGPCGYPDPEERARFWDELLLERTGILDDSVPSAYLTEMDQGLYGGLLGAEVRFTCDPATGWISSMVAPLLEDWSGFERLTLRGAGQWLGRYRDQLRVFQRRARGRFGVAPVIAINGLNFAFELVGATATYLAMTDQPAEWERCLELGHRVNRLVQRIFFQEVPLLEGGTCGYGVQWIAGRVIQESVDPFHMTAARDFVRWGRPVLERIFAEFDGGVTHIHANGRHLLAEVSRVSGLRAVILGDDRGLPAAFEELPDLRRQAGDIPLVCPVPFERFREALASRRLVGGVLYIVEEVPDTDQANRLMDRVRSCRANAEPAARAAQS